MKPTITWKTRQGALCAREAHGHVFPIQSTMDWYGQVLKAMLPSVGS